MAALALHRQGSVARHCEPHRAPQASRGRAWVTLVTRLSIRNVVQFKAAHRIRYFRVMSMHRGSEWLRTRIASGPKGLRGVASCAKDRLSIQLHRIKEPGAAEMTRGEGSLIGCARYILLIVKPEDIQPVISLWIGVIHPTALRFRRIV
jgi:hypothetical protein